MSVNIIKVHAERSVDGEQHLVKVRFTPYGPNPASEATIEAVFEHQDLESFLLDKIPMAFFPLSCTTCDTREPYVMSRPMRKQVVQAAMNFIAEKEDE